MKGMVRSLHLTTLRAGAACALALVVFAARGQAQSSPPADSSAPKPADSVTAKSGAGPDGVSGAYRTHTVRAGETLYDLADRYLGDGDLWPSIYRLNAAIIPDPHWLYPNLVLRIPNNKATSTDSVPPATVADAAPAPAAVDTTPAPALAAETGAIPQSAAPPADVTADQTTESQSSATMFNRPQQRAPLFPVGRPGGLPGSKPAVMVPGEHYAAPYVDHDGGPAHAGVVLGTSSLSNVLVDQSGRSPYTLLEDIYVKMPAGVTPVVGQRLYTFSLGDSFGERGQVVRPTGILVVRQPGSAKVATVARIMKMFGNIDLGQGVLPVEPFTLPTAVPQPIEGGIETHVLFVQHVLPTIMYYVILDASAKQGIHIGDEVTLYRPPTFVPEHGISLPRADIAVAQIVRVNDFGSSAIVLRQFEPDITSGVSVRVSAREPQ
jgi:hypothetical protein